MSLRYGEQVVVFNPASGVSRRRERQRQLRRRTYYPKHGGVLGAVIVRLKHVLVASGFSSLSLEICFEILDEPWKQAISGRLVRNLQIHHSDPQTQGHLLNQVRNSVSHANELNIHACQLLIIFIGLKFDILEFSTLSS